MTTTLATVWDYRFLESARDVGSWSKDPSTKVGAVIVNSRNRRVSEGFNGFPRGIADTVERLSDREVKYALTIHAEENAILAAAMSGSSVEGCTMYVTLPPCSRCAARLIEVGIKRIVTAYPGADFLARWKDSLLLAREILHEAGVEFQYVSDFTV